MLWVVSFSGDMHHVNCPLNCEYNSCFHFKSFVPWTRWFQDFSIFFFLRDKLKRTQALFFLYWISLVWDHFWVLNRSLVGHYVMLWCHNEGKQIVLILIGLFDSRITVSDTKQFLFLSFWVSRQKAKWYDGWIKVGIMYSSLYSCLFFQSLL